MKNLRSFVLSFIILFSNVTIAGKSIQCGEILSNLAISESQRELAILFQRKGLKAFIEEFGKDESKRLALREIINRDLKNKSIVLNELIAKVGSSKSYDVVTIGAGIHGAIFNNNLPKSFKSLTIESSGEVANTFRQFGDSFRINSPELGDKTANLFPGCPVQMSSMTNDKFPMASYMADLTLFNQFASSSELLLSNKVISIDGPKTAGAGKWPARYRLKLSNGGYVFTNNVVVSTGLGTPRFGVTDVESLKVIEEQIKVNVSDLKKTPSIQIFDDAMARAAQTYQSGISANEGYDELEVALIGSGDGANVFVEMMMGLSPERIYPSGSYKPKKLFWYNQKATNAIEYRAQNKARYHQTVGSFFESGDRSIMEPIGFKVSKISKVDSGGKIRFKVFYVSSDGSEIAREVDRVVFATGYENKMKDLIEMGMGPVEFQDVVGVAADGSKGTLAKQVQGEDIYIIGPAAGALASDEELQSSITKNAVSINVLGSKSAGFGSNFGSIGKKRGPSSMKKKIKSLYHPYDHQMNHLEWY